MNIKFNIIGNNNIIEIGDDAFLSDMMIYIRGDYHKVTIGKACRFKGGSIWIEDNYCELIIGKKTTIESAHLAITEPNNKIIIGEDCMFSMDIDIRTGDSHSIIDNDTQKRINFAKDVIIGNHVWIGAHATILKGTTIGDNSIIGTNSIVTKNILNNSIAAGIPAKIVKQNINWLRERIYN